MRRALAVAVAALLACVPAAAADTAFDTTRLALDGWSVSCPSAGGWPAACWRPFSSRSPFNTPLPANPRPAPNSKDVIDRIVTDLSRYNFVANLAVGEDGSGGEPTYYARPTDPAFRIRCTNGPCVRGIVRIPAGAGREMNTDQHMAVVDPIENVEHDFWGVSVDRIPARGGTLTVRAASRVSLDGAGNGAGTTASGFAGLAGRVRVEELVAGRIDHALNVTFRCSDGAPPLWPATGHAGDPCDASFARELGEAPDVRRNRNAPRMGARFRLTLTPGQIDALPGVPEHRKAVYRAMATYGMFFGDTGGDHLLGIEMESGRQYSTVGAEDRWWRLAQTPGSGWFDFRGETGEWLSRFRDDLGIDWAMQLEMVDPCVTAQTC